VTEPDRPILVVYGIANETSEHINTGGITDDIRLKLLKSGQYRFITICLTRRTISTQASFLPKSASLKGANSVQTTSSLAHCDP